MADNTRNDTLTNNPTGAVDVADTARRAEWLSWSDAQGNWLRMAVALFAIAFAIWHVATNLFLNEPGLWQNAIHFAGFAILAAITVPAFANAKPSRIGTIINVIYGLAVAASALWVAGAESAVYARSLAVTGQSWQFNAVDWAAGFILIFAALDLSRRVSGWVIPILIIIIFPLSFHQFV